MASLKGKNRFAGITTPLGPDALVLRRATIHERLSEPFEIDLNLLSEDTAISFEDIVGKSVTLRLDLAGDEKRYFNGIVNTFAQAGSDTGFSEYNATVVPDLWTLSRASHCRLFQEKSVPDILKKVLDEHHVAHEERLHGNYPALEFCVQYRETDLNYCSRMMELVGIYYFFVHEDGKHTLVLADSQSAHETFPGYEKVNFRPYSDETIAGEFVRDWTAKKMLLSNQYVHKDFDFMKPRNNLLRQVRTARYSPNRDLEIYDYPGDYIEPSLGEQLAKVRIEEIAARYETMSGISDARGISAGYRFSLGRGAGVSFPHEGDFRDYLVTSATHSIVVPVLDAEESGGERPYECTFSVIPQSEQFRPERRTPKPRVQGPQTAIVVGPKGEEVYTDKHGRIKVQFHWDRDGKFDENSSCWIRVSQTWAGKGWGSMSIPRIGQEVMVDYLEGDPDRPIITGRVYNGDCGPPYGATQGLVSGLKSNTHKGKGFNEMSMDDTAKSEKITIHAQHDMNTTVEHDATHTVVSGKYEHDVATGTSKHHVKGAVTEIFDDTQDTYVKNGISITSGTAHIYIHTATSIQLHVGASKLWMDSGGQILLDGKHIQIVGSEKVEIVGGQVISKADTNHETSGADVKSVASVTNTVKGKMVMLNP